MLERTKPLYAELEDVLWELHKIEYVWDQGCSDARAFFLYEELERRAGDLLARIREWTA